MGVPKTDRRGPPDHPRGARKADTLVEMTAAGRTEQPGDVAAALPTIATALTAEQVVATLDAVARRGKLPGFAAGAGALGGPPVSGGPGGPRVLFVVDAFSTPFDGRLRARVVPDGTDGQDVRPTKAGIEVVPERPTSMARDVGTTGSAGATLAFDVRLKPLWPTVFVVAMVLAIWPGVLLTESLLASLFPHTPWTWAYTWWWYMPLSIVGCPWAIWDVIRRSRRGTRLSAREAIAGIAKELGAS